MTMLHAVGNTTDRTEGRREFELLVEQNGTRLVAAATAIVGSKHVAEEIVQECLLRTLQRWHSVRELDKPDAWVHRVVVNESISTLRRARTESVVADKVAMLSPQRSGGSTHTDVSDGLPDSDLWSAVRSLADDHATALALRYAADYSLEQVAAALSITPSATNALLFRARKALRSTLLTLATHDESHEQETHNG